MDKKEFNLSEKIERFEKEHWIDDELDGVPRVLIESSLSDWEKLKEDIKEFIKKLKEEVLTDKSLKDWEIRIITIIDKLAGDKLI